MKQGHAQSHHCPRITRLQARATMLMNEQTKCSSPTCSHLISIIIMTPLKLHARPWLDEDAQQAVILMTPAVAEMVDAKVPSRFFCMVMAAIQGCKAVLLPGIGGQTLHIGFPAQARRNRTPCKWSRLHKDQRASCPCRQCSQVHHSIGSIDH